MTRCRDHYTNQHESDAESRDILAAFGHQGEGALLLVGPIPADERMGKVLVSNWLGMLTYQPMIRSIRGGD